MNTKRPFRLESIPTKDQLLNSLKERILKAEKVRHELEKNDNNSDGRYDGVLRKLEDFIATASAVSDAPDDIEMGTLEELLRRARELNLERNID